MIKLIVGLAVLFPLLFVTDYTTGTNMTSSYLVFLSAYWRFIFIGYVSYELAKKAYKTRYEELESMRFSQYINEVQRYHGTPYVPAIMAWYLKNPPSAFSPRTGDYINNRFYQMVVNDFRDNVYVFRDFNSFEPYGRSSFINVVGWSKILRLTLLTFVSFGWFGYWFLQNDFFTNWPFFTLPFVIMAWVKIIVSIQAILYHLPSNLDSMLNGSDVRLFWREAFPDKPFGHTVLRAYLYEKEKRMRYEATFNNHPMGPSLDSWNHYAFPEPPYPHYDLPEWADDYEALYIQKAEQLELENSSKKPNIVPFKKVT